ncbi:MAG TPA: FIST N-terminal domain-containing protein [Longimicrobiales bacterium]|nr:FIST N-terminal domain-containing protein [Longimicrobiales bacterium]
MTEAVISQTDRSGADGGRTLGDEIVRRLGGKRPHAVIVFASPDQDHEALLQALRGTCGSAAMVGCSSAGEFTSEAAGPGMTCAVAVHAPDMVFSAAIGRGLREDRRNAAGELVAGFRGESHPEFGHRAALVLTDALAGFADDLVERLTIQTGGVYRFFGGGAGDDARFERTHVFCGEEVATDAVVALEILSHKQIGIGVQHGWSPGENRMRVTEAAGMTVTSLNAAPAVEAFEAHAAATGQRLDREAPIPFFLHNVLGVESAQGYRLRVPLAVGTDGSVSCAADVPEGAGACIMATTPAAAADAASAATRSALDQLEGNEPAVALVFDCVATRLRLGSGFEEELAAVQKELGDTSFAGFNTYGQIAQAAGQFSGFHNCTAVVCVIPR